MAKTIRFPVEASHIMMFARAVGDPNPIYQAPDAPVAPPTFPMAVAQFDPDYSLRPKPGEAWFGSGKTASGVTGKPTSLGILHGEQHFEYHRPLRAGDVLSVEHKDGKTWEKDSKRGGNLKFSEKIAEYRDQSGQLVATARSVIITTARPVDQG